MQVNFDLSKNSVHMLTVNHMRQNVLDIHELTFTYILVHKALFTFVIARQKVSTHSSLTHKEPFALFIHK